MSILTSALHSALSRFLTISLEQGDEGRANKIFNTALFGLIGVIILFSFLILPFSVVFPTIFNVPAGWEKDVRWLLVTIAISFFITVIGSNFSVSLFMYSQFLKSNVVEFIALLARMGFIVIIFYFLPARLWYTGGGALIGSIVAILSYIMLWKRYTPELNIKVTAFDQSQLSSLMSMGWWVVVTRVGSLLLNRIDLIVVNIFFGAALTGGYASAAQFSLLIEYLVSAAGNVVRPIILIKYAQKDLSGLNQISSQAVKLLGLSLAIPVGLLCGFSRPLLIIWLGPSFDYLSILLVIIVGHLSLNLSVRPLQHVLNAYNKVRWPGIATLIGGGVGLGLAIIFAAWGKWGGAGIALAGALVLFGKNTLFIPIYTARVMELPWWTFFPSLLPSIIGTVFVGITAYGFSQIMMPNTWFSLARCGAIVSIVYILIVWLTGLNRADRRMLKNIFHIPAR
jgi:membrane protein EpsK